MMEIWPKRWTRQSVWWRLLLVISLASLQCSDKKPPGSGSIAKRLRPTLTFYHIPDCFLCLELKESLKEFERDHSGRLRFHSVDYHQDSSQIAIDRFKLGTHGIVITSAEGDVLWSMPAHDQEPGALAAAITLLTQ